MTTTWYGYSIMQSRLSPFANSKRRMERKVNKAMHTTSKASKPKISKRWFQLVDAATLSKKRALLPVKKLRNSLLLNRELHRTLYGFIVFEVSWTNVRGINYLNELQVIIPSSWSFLGFQCNAGLYVLNFSLFGRRIHLWL